jgi:predicted enzyme involved in methoxymalonyl-ACP biosynthesis
VLNRGVEAETLNEIVRLATAAGCDRVLGSYLPTSKNGMVRDLYTTLGFAKTAEYADRTEFVLETAQAERRTTHIHIARRAYDPE